MKKVFAFLLACLSLKGAKAQTFDEWFKQKATQKKYLLEQIAAMQACLGYLKEGYTIAKKGLNTIGDIKRGELHLHTGHFNSLKTVNPLIRDYQKVAEIIRLQIRILSVYRSASGQIRNSQAFTDAEISYFGSVFERLLDDCSKAVDDLIMVISSNQLEMKDDERISRIDRIYSDMQDKYTFATAFSGEAKMLAASRLREQEGVQNSRIIHGIKK